MKIAITGATGFIGQSLVKQIIKNNQTPIVIVRNKSKIPKFFSHCKIVEIDLSDINNDCFDVIGKPDILIHLAWGGLPNYNSEKHLVSELPIHINFLTNMISSGLKNLFVTGTCFEYGLTENGIKENSTLKPVNYYGKAKVDLLYKLQFLQNKFDFNLTWARVFYIYGKGQSNRSLIGQLEESIKKK